MHKDDPATLAASPTAPIGATPQSMDAFWMPFTANRQFKAAPRMLAKAQGMHYWTPEGRQ
ncbi:MAG: aspartate aminotransferase family protein, partial [Burkholderiales bacterium]